MKYILAAVVGLVVGLFVGGLFHGPAKAAIAIRDSSHVEALRLDSSESQRHAVDSLAVDSVAVRQTRVDRSLPRAAAAGHAADSLTQRLDSLLRVHVQDSTARAGLAALIYSQDSTRRVQVTLLASALTDVLAQRDSWRDRFYAADAAARAAVAENKHNVVRIDSLVGMTRQTHRCGLGGAAGYSLTTNGSGPGVTVGVSCRI